MKTILIFLSLLLAVSGFSAPLTNTITYDWLDFGYQVDSVTNKPVKITPLEYSTIGSFFMVKTPRIYTNTFAGRCIVTNQQEGSYRVELATALGSITTFTSTIPATATGGTNYEATQFVTNFATNSGSTRSYSITVSDLRYPSTAGSNILFFTNAGRVTIAGTVVTGTSPTVASNYLAATKLDATNGTAYALTVSGLLNSTNMDAKISAASNTVHTALIATNTLLFTNMDAKISDASNTVHTALIATNTLLFTNIFSLNTAANNNANNVTSISNRVIQAEVTNAVQQTALDGLTNSIATKQLGSAALTNLSAEVNVATNIIGAGFGITVSSNNAGTWTITGATTNYIATTNGSSLNLSNRGAMYSDRLVVTNLIVGTNTSWVVVSNGNITATGDISAGGSRYMYANVFQAANTVDTPYLTSSYQGGGKGGMITLNLNEVGVIEMRDRQGTNFNRLNFGLQNSNFPALKRNAASLEVTDAVGNSRATNNFIVPGVVFSTNGFASYASNKLAVTLVTLPASPSGWTNSTSANVSIGWSGGTVTGVGINSSTWPTSLTGGMAILQPGEWITFTNSSIPTFGWKPF